MDISQYFRETLNLLSPSCLSVNKYYSPSNTAWFGHLWPKNGAIKLSCTAVSLENRNNRIFEALFAQDSDIVQMRDMAHSICLIKLYQITMRKKFDFLFLTALMVIKLSHTSHIVGPNLMKSSGNDSIVRQYVIKHPLGRCSLK